MKSHLKTLYYFTILSSLSFPTLGKEVNLCVENLAYPPMLNGSEQIISHSPGKFIEIVQQAEANVELKINFTRLPWARCLKLVATGKVDGLLPLVKTAERANIYQYPDNEAFYLGQTAYHIFYSSSSRHKDFYHQLAQAKDKSKLPTPQLSYGLSAPFAYKVTTDLKHLGLLSNHYYKPDIGITMVANNKLDGYIMMKSIGERKIQKLALSKHLEISKAAFSKDKIYVAFNKDFYRKNNIVVDEFWRQLQLARTDKLGY